MRAVQDVTKARARTDANRDKLKPSTWDGMGDGDGRNRPQMASDDVNDSQALTGGDITMHRVRVARISYLSQDRSDLKCGSMQVCCAMAKPSTRDMERVKRIGRYLLRSRGRRAASAGGRVVSWNSDADWRRQSHSTIGVSWSHHERRTLPQGMDQEAASGVPVRC